MSRPIVLTTDAVNDLREAKDWYDSKQHGLSLALADEVDEALTKIAEHPLRWPEVVSPARRYRLSRFPFSIPYLVEESRIVVLGVLHAARDPAILRRRLARRRR